MRFKGAAQRLAKLGCTFTLTCSPADGGFIWSSQIALPDSCRVVDSTSTIGPRTAADAAVREAKRMLGID